MKPPMANMVFAAFPTHEDADSAISDLVNFGFTDKDISVITKENKNAETKSIGSDTASGAASGATTGGVIGGVAGLLAGAGIFPALAGLMIGGPVVAVLGLTGLAAATVSGVVTGAVAGGLIGALVGLGFSEEDAKYYDQVVESSGVIVALPMEGRDRESVEALLVDNGAQRIREITTTSGSTSADAAVL